MALKWIREIVETELLVTKDPKQLARWGDLFEGVFYASVMQEEGEPVSFTLVIDEGQLEDDVDGSERVPPWEAERVWAVTWFEPAVQFTSKRLKKLARAVAYPREQIVVGWVDGADQFMIKGIARRNSATDGGQAVRIAVPRPGVLVIEGPDGLIGQFEAGEFTRELFEVVYKEGPVASALQACGVAGGLEGTGRPVVAELLRQSRATHCGGLLLFVPGSWTHAIDPGAYRLKDPELIRRPVEMEPKWQDYVAAGLTEENSDSEEKRPVREELTARRRVSIAERERAVNQIAQLSAMDGAVLFEHDLKFVAAGFVVPTGGGALPSVMLAKDVTASKRVAFEVVGGARQRAAIRFAEAHPGSVAFAVSADGPVSCFTKFAGTVVCWHVWVPET